MRQALGDEREPGLRFNVQARRRDERRDQRIVVAISQAQEDLSLRRAGQRLRTAVVREE
jgi:hypothetical protein